MPDRETELKTFICFDYGKKRIGVATGQSLTRTASELETIKAVENKPDWQSISRIIQKWQPGALVLGLPLNDDGTEHQMPKAVRHSSTPPHPPLSPPAALPLALEWSATTLSSSLSAASLSMVLTKLLPRAA